MTIGLPVAQISTFGGGSLGDSVDDNPVGTTVDFGSGGSLTVESDGAFTFIPEPTFSGLFLFDYQLAGAAGTSTASVLIQVGEPTGPPTDLVICVSSTTQGTVEGLAFADEDIVCYDSQASTWSLLFDGSDVNIGGSDLDAFHIHSLDPLVIDLSLSTPRNLPGLGLVDDSDVVTFTGLGGADTSGSFSLKLDGSDIGLSSNGEDVDALAIAGADLLISTEGNHQLTQVSGADEDAFRFSPTSLGSTTSGSAEVEFDGSDVGLARRDLVGLSAAPGAGAIFGAALSSWTLGDVSGDGDDVFWFSGTFGSATAGTAEIVFDGDDVGYGNEQIDGLSVLLAPAGG